LSDRLYLRAIRTAEILPGGMKVVELEGRQLVICNAGGSFHAIDRRCGHMNAPLELGTLDGTILTCAMHCAQFDVVTGGGTRRSGSAGPGRRVDAAPAGRVSPQCGYAHAAYPDRVTGRVRRQGRWGLGLGCALGTGGLFTCVSAEPILQRGNH
jgi:nitrite reductase/ring-hydroxylating ferredoxin subunit